MQLNPVSTLLRSIVNRGALITIKMLLFELFFEWRYKIKTRKMYGDLIEHGYNEIPYSNMYMASNYFLLDRLLKQLFMLIEKEKIVFVDYGSGKGRVLIFLSTYSTGKIYGVEFSDYLCEHAKKNINLFNSTLLNNRIHIIHSDAVCFQPPKDCNVFYFYNPFRVEAMEAVLGQIDKSSATVTKSIYVIYLNPVLDRVLKLFGYKEVYALKSKKHLEGIIYHKSYSNGCH